jgi:co-chaperonin GroES (HSP10)
MTSAIGQQVDDDYEDYAKQFPQPTGWKILIALPAPEEKTEGGLIKAAETLRTEEYGSICGQVLEMGPDCYKDKSKFPGGPYCEVGDWIMMRAYSGTRFRIGRQELRLINDETVEAVVEDPSGIVRI